MSMPYRLKLRTEVPDPARKHGDLASKRIVRINPDHVHVEFVQSLQQNLHDSGRNFTNVLVLQIDRLKNNIQPH